MGRERLVTACSQPVEEWMKIKTHSPRVIKARKTIVELLLSNHPDDCLYCDRNLDCELQRLSEELNIRERRIRGKKVKLRLDQSSPAIVRELSKCILCGRCVRVCEEQITATTLDFINRGGHTHIGTAMDRDFNFSSCVHCGQCVQVCPTGALHEKHNITEVQDYLNNQDVTKIIQYSPLVPLAVAENLGIKYTKEFDKVLNAVLRKIGFDRVFSTGFGTDICISEISGELLTGMENPEQLPLFISSCPAWVKYVEQFIPSFIPLLSKVKSPQQIVGILIKTLVAGQLKLTPEQIFSVSVTPCTAMKFEAKRDGMMRKGISDVDAVLTVRELSRLIRIYGIDILTVEGELADEPMADRSSSAVLAENSGGIAEAVIRSLFYDTNKTEPDKQALKKLRSSSGFRETSIIFNDKEIRIAVVDGLNSLDKLTMSMESGNKYNLVEVMACSGGCVHGGGLPFCTSKEVLKNRAKVLYQADETEAISVPGKSPSVFNLYDKFLKENEEISDKKVFYTHYVKREVLL